MKRFLMSVCCAVLSVQMSGCAGQMGRSHSYYSAYTSKGEGDKYEVSGKARITGSEGILYVSPSENTSIKLNGELKDITGSVQVVYVSPEKEKVVISDREKSQEGTLLIDLDISLDQGGGWIEFRGENVSFQFELVFSEIEQDKYNYISFEKKSVYFKTAELLYYENESPYLHDVWTNNTDKTIIGMEQGMLAYDESGQPLRVEWNFPDNYFGGTPKSAYENETVIETKILPKQTYNLDGGWSIYDRTNGDRNTTRVCYALYCIKNITFEDGSVWDNPKYDEWMETYKGKAVETETLQRYYPYECIVIQ